MSIVEKAIQSSLKNQPTVRPREDSFSDQQDDGGASDTEAVSRVVDIHHLAGVGFSTVLENGDLARSFRFLKRAVLAVIFGSPDSQSEARKVVMITSAVPGAGKSFMALNLAASIAQEQLVNVVLVDADTVRHNLTTLFGLDDRVGLIEALMSKGIDQELCETSLSGLHFLPSGRHHAHGTELLASAYMSNLLSEMEDPDTVIILDTTPLLVSSEADAIATHVDHVFVVVEAGDTLISEIESVLQMLDKSGSRISFIMNKLVRSNERGSSAYSSYYYP